MTLESSKCLSIENQSVFVFYWNGGPIYENVKTLLNPDIKISGGSQ